MKTSAAHYATHLGPIYSWMLGDIDAAFARSTAEIEDLELPEANHGAAVDLGAGLGLHALPLARRGFRVTAIDSCQVLLDELRSRSGTLAVTAVNADLVDYRAVVKEEPRVVLCMGDTLTHLPTLAAVESLLKSVADGLARGGVFAARARRCCSTRVYRCGRRLGSCFSSMGICRFMNSLNRGTVKAVSPWR